MAERLSRAGRAVTALVAGAVLAVVLAGCSEGDALALARQACAHVQRSIDLYKAAAAGATPAQQQADSAQALTELRTALPLAARAAGANGQWEALMTTLSESSRVSEVNLIPALSAQCADAAGGGVPPPTSVPSASTPQSLSGRAGTPHR